MAFDNLLFAVATPAIFISVWVLALIFRVSRMQIGASISITTFCIGALWNLFNTRESTMEMTLLGYYALIAVIILFVLKVTLPVEVFGVRANVRPRIAVPAGNTMVDLPMHGPLGAPYARSCLAVP